MEKFEKNRWKKTEFYFSGETVSPEYKITVERADGEDDWTISGKIYNITSKEAKSLDIIAKEDNSEKISRIIQENSRQAQQKRRISFGKIAAATIIGSLIIGAVSISFKKMPKEENMPKDDNSTNEQVITLYGVSIDTDIFSEMYNVNDCYNLTSVNIASLRGVESLHDSEYTIYSEDIKDIKSYVEKIKSFSDVDLDDLTKKCIAVIDFSGVALEDFSDKLYDDEEKYSEDIKILQINQKLVRNILTEGNGLCYDVSNAKYLSIKYPDSKFHLHSQNSDSYVYGTSNEYFKLFSTQEEAQRYYDEFISAFESEMSKDEYINLYYFYKYNASINQYDIIGTEDVDYLECDSEPENAVVTKILTKSKDISERP